MHLNENPYGCSLLVQESLSISDSLAQLPGPLSRTLLRSLSRYAGRPTSDIHLSNSPGELLAHILTTLLGVDGRLVAYTPHSSRLARVATVSGTRIVPVRRNREGVALASAALQKLDDGIAAVHVGSPNDPTGDVVAPTEVVALLGTGLTVIVDETYAEFTDKSLGILGREFPNLVSLRSFAPWAGLWGIPVSYALASPETVEQLDARWPQSTVSAASRIAAGASLDDVASLLNRVKHLRLERARLFRRLRKLNFVQPAPSHGPFILCEVTRGDADRVCSLLETDGVLVHNCVEEGLPGFIRVSVGTSDQTDQLITAMCRISVYL